MFHKGSTPIAGWFTKENPIYKWIMSGGSPISGNPIWTNRETSPFLIYLPWNHGFGMFWWGPVLAHKFKYIDVTRIQVFSRSFVTKISPHNLAAENKPCDTQNMLQPFDAFCRDNSTMISGDPNTRSPTTKCNCCTVVRQTSKNDARSGKCVTHCKQTWRIHALFKRRGKDWHGHHGHRLCPSLRDGQHFQKSWASQWCFLPMDSDPRNLPWHLTS